jgi:DNA-binding transcriptional regulator of glucitol operon
MMAGLEEAEMMEMVETPIKVVLIGSWCLSMVFFSGWTQVLRYGEVLGNKRL